MEAPRCRLCGKRHWGICEGAGHAWVTHPISTEVPVNSVTTTGGAETVWYVANKVVHATPKVVHKPVMVVHKSKHGVYADLEKRRAYRREWKRKRRLEKGGVV